MRKVLFSAATSLDHYIARSDHSFDWILWNDEAAAAMADFWKTIDTVLMGRKTYEVALQSGQGAGGTAGVHTYVFSRTLNESAERNVTIISTDAAEFVGRLKHQAGNDVCLMGGGELATSLFEAGLIDELRLSIHPLLLGSGIPLFRPMSRQIDLDLRECKAFRNGCVLVKYGVNR